MLRFSIQHSWRRQDARLSICCVSCAAKKKSAEKWYGRLPHNSDVGQRSCGTDKRYATSRTLFEMCFKKRRGLWPPTSGFDPMRLACGTVQLPFRCGLDAALLQNSELPSHLPFPRPFRNDCVIFFVYVFKTVIDGTTGKENKSKGDSSPECLRN